MCQHTFETSFLQEGFGNVELWHRVSSGAQMETGRILSLDTLWLLCPVDSCGVPLGPGIGAIVVVSPVILGVSAFLGDQLSPGGIWV